MKIQVTAPPLINAAPWLRRYATALIVIALVGLATLGVGIAQMVYTTSATRTNAVGVSIRTEATLDQHERHSTQPVQIAMPHE